MADFGIQIEPSFGFTYEEVLSIARALPGHGYTSLWASDHFMLGPGEPDRNCMDCWTLLSALAAATTDIRLGSLVTCMSYRNPAVLAKVVASADLVSGGRINFGIGAGWKDDEYRAYGVPFPSPGERVDRFIEGMEIITRLWTEPRVTYEGRYYRVDNAVAAPKPVQAPHPPILIGGTRPRMLRAMARFADVINMGGFPAPDAYASSLARFETICREEGRDYAAIEKSHFGIFVVAETDAGVDELVRRVAAREGLTVDAYRERRARAFIGTVDGAVDLLKRFTDLGVTQFMTVFPFGEEERSLRLFADHVLPRV